VNGSNNKNDPSFTHDVRNPDSTSDSNCPYVVDADITDYYINNTIYQEQCCYSTQRLYPEYHTGPAPYSCYQGYEPYYHFSQFNHDPQEYYNSSSYPTNTSAINSGYCLDEAINDTTHSSLLRNQERNDIFSRTTKIHPSMCETGHVKNTDISPTKAAIPETVSAFVVSPNSSLSNIRKIDLSENRHSFRSESSFSFIMPSSDELSFVNSISYNSV
jgi:hypothetical protein